MNVTIWGDWGRLFGSIGIWSYLCISLENESLPDDITNPNGLINFTLQMVDRSFTTLNIKASGIHVKTGMKPG